MQVAKHGKPTSFLKWAGGKEQELKYILPLLSPFRDYYEPFVGGGALFFSVQAERKFINDKSTELIALYRHVVAQEATFLSTLEALAHSWQQISSFVEQQALPLVHSYQAYSLNHCSYTDLEQWLFGFIEQQQEKIEAWIPDFLRMENAPFLHEVRRNLFSKTQRMKQLEQRKWRLPERDVFDNIECALKSAFYMQLRYIYNNSVLYRLPEAVVVAIFFFIRENAYASMFRYNQQKQFNVPYGGISYNRKDITRKISYMRSSALQEHLQNTVIECMDFEAFLTKYRPEKEDFLFLDPPYDTEFNTYAGNAFTLQDQERLAQYLLEDCAAQFMLVIKNTPTIMSLYAAKGLHIRTFSKKYMVSFQDRNDKNAEHLIITNF